MTPEPTTLQYRPRDFIYLLEEMLERDERLLERITALEQEVEVLRSFSTSSVTSRVRPVLDNSALPFVSKEEAERIFNSANGHVSSEDRRKVIAYLLRFTPKHFCGTKVTNRRLAERFGVNESLIRQDKKRLGYKKQ